MIMTMLLLLLLRCYDVKDMKFEVRDFKIRGSAYTNDVT